jgi:predicted YcjX-like family ATPase
MTTHPEPVNTDRQLASGGQVQPTMYEIYILGRVTERLGSALEGMRLEAGATETVFTGEIRDQSQLYGLLDRIRDLGLELVSVRPQPAAYPTTTTHIRKDL